MIKKKYNEVPTVYDTDEVVPPPEDIVFFFRNCFSPSERKFKVILLTMMGLGLRVNEGVQIELKDFIPDSGFRKLKVRRQKRVKTLRMCPKCRGFVKTSKDTCYCARCDKTFSSDMVITKLSGKDKIETLELPESIACYLRSWISDNLDWIYSKGGYIFPHTNNNSLHCPASSVQNFMIKKRKYLAEKYPLKSFGKVVGCKNYNSNKVGCFNKKYDNTYMWRPHLMKKILGTFLSIQNENPLLIQQILGHADFRTTQKHYIDPARIIATNQRQKAINKLFDTNFYDAIKHEREEVPAIWDNLKNN